VFAWLWKKINNTFLFSQPVQYHFHGKWNKFKCFKLKWQEKDFPISGILRFFFYDSLNIWNVKFEIDERKGKGSGIFNLNSRSKGLLSWFLLKWINGFPHWIRKLWFFFREFTWLWDPKGLCVNHVKDEKISLMRKLDDFSNLEKLIEIRGLRLWAVIFTTFSSRIPWNYLVSLWVI
jgi:hypothetical protein